MLYAISPLPSRIQAGFGRKNQVGKATFSQNIKKSQTESPKYEIRPNAYASFVYSPHFGQSGPSPIPLPSELQDNTIETWHGVEVADPFRPMERDCKALTDWIQANNRRTEEFLNDVGSVRQAALNWHRAMQKGDIEEGLPEHYGNYSFFTRKEPGDKQFKLYVQTLGDSQKKSRVLVDPNAMAKDGSLSLKSFYDGRRFFASPDGQRIAYVLSKNGGDFCSLRIMDVATGQVLPDVLDNVFFPEVTWDPDGKGFSYSKPIFNQKGLYAHDALMHHTLENDQKQDKLLLERPDLPVTKIKAGRLSAEDPDLFAIVTLGSNGHNGLYYRAEGTETFKEIIPPNQASLRPIYRKGHWLYAQTGWGNPMGRFVQIDLNKPDRENWKTLFEAEAGSQLKYLSTLSLSSVISFVAGNKLFIQWEDDCGQGKLEMRELDGSNPQTVRTPPGTSIRITQASPKDTSVLLECKGYLSSPVQYRLNTQTGRLTEIKKGRIDLSGQFDVNRLYATASDGTRVPVTVISAKNMPHDGLAATLLHGYGGYGVPERPLFSLKTLHWLQQGGTYAVAHIRGGGELGDDWHEGGISRNRKNSFDDFTACAKALIEHGYTRPERLAITGESLGGLTAGGAVFQQPELFSAAILRAPVIDPFSLQRAAKQGVQWQTELGDIENPDDFKAIMDHSPQYNVQKSEETKYPPMLLYTTRQDDRCPAWQSYKFLAMLQSKGHANAYLQVQSNGGHFVGGTAEQEARQAANEYAFLVRALGPLKPSTIQKEPIKAV